LTLSDEVNLEILKIAKQNDILRLSSIINDSSNIDKFKELEDLDLVDIVTFDGVGAEKFAEHAFNFADELIREATNNRCYVVSVECAEHGANSAIYSIE